MITWNVCREMYTKVYREGTCLSSDTKPTTDPSMLNGSILIELDTSTIYFYDEENSTWRAWE